MAITGLLFFAAARLCIALPLRNDELTAVWLPSGIALSAVLLWGRWTLVGVFAADVATSLVSGLALPLSLGLAAGDTLEPAIGAALILGLAGRRAIRTVRGIAVIAVATFVATAVSATIGTTLLRLANEVAHGNYGTSWHLYWSSTSTAILLVTTTVLAWQARDDRPSWMTSAPTRRVVAEALALASLLVGAAVAVFVLDQLELVGVFLTYPLFIWATMRFGRVGAALSVLVVGSIGVVGVAREWTHLAGIDRTQTVELLQVLLSLVVLTNLILATVLSERDRARASTSELLQVFSQAQELAGVGSWQVRLPRDLAARPAPARRPGWPDMLAAVGPRPALVPTTPVWCSREFARIFGFDPARHYIQVSELVDRVEPGEREALLAAIRSAISRHGGYSIEHTVRQPEGSRRIVRHVGTVVDHEDEDTDRVVGCVLDITAQRDLELHQDALVTTASHELRTPLTSVIGFSETINRTWDEISEAERRRFLLIIEEQAHRLGAIVEDTLAQSRVDHNTLSFHPADVDLTQVVEAAVAENDTSAIEVDVPAGMRAYADPEHLRRIVTNLVTNAQKYGRPPIRVTATRTAFVSTGDSEARPGIALRVTDHGDGPPPGFEDHMFERFVRGPDTAGAPGTGLGLSIARGLAELLGGSLTYRREDGLTVFELLVLSPDHMSVS